MLCCQLQLEFAPYFHRGAECCTVLIIFWRYFNAHQGVISKAFLTTTVRGIFKGRGFTARGRGGNRFRVSSSSSSETVIFTCLLFSSWSWCKFFFSFCGLLPSLLKLKNPASELTIMGPELRIYHQVTGRSSPRRTADRCFLNWLFFANHHESLNFFFFCAENARDICFVAPTSSTTTTTMMTTPAIHTLKRTWIQRR